jgi:hypothetical protein
MPPVAWAYDFTCRQPIAAMRAAFDAAGPWQWQLRESDFHGDYLSCRPQPRVRLRVHDQEQIGRGQYLRRRADGFLALLEIEPGGTAARGEIDAVFRRLLEAIGATDVREIEPYD